VLYSGGTGEAETGSAGEQPDRGIAGAELIADDEKGVVLPTRSCLGPGAGQREAVGLGPRMLVLTLVFGL
jgi:hypothetical protein